MSNTETFIDEVSEEVRRDKLYASLKKYGWIAAVAILLLVGATAWNEYNKAQAVAKAQDLGDGVLDALSQETPASRADALAGLDADAASADAIVGLLRAAELAETGDGPAAAEVLSGIAVADGTPEIYRQIAAFKAVLAAAATTDVADTRIQLEAMSSAGHPMRLLAQEQLALLDVQAGEGAKAIAAFQAILSDAEASAALQQRAAQAIVALGGTPELPATTSDG